MPTGPSVMALPANISLSKCSSPKTLSAGIGLHSKVVSPQTLTIRILLVERPSEPIGCGAGCGDGAASGTWVLVLRLGPRAA